MTYIDKIVYLEEQLSKLRICNHIEARYVDLKNRQRELDSLNKNIINMGLKAVDKSKYLERVEDLKKEIRRYDDIKTHVDKRNIRYLDLVMTMLLGTVCFFLGTKYEDLIDRHEYYKQNLEQEKIARISRKVFERLKERGSKGG